MNRVTFAQLVEKRVAKDFDIVKQDEQYYVHPTFCISNLSDYIRIITMISSANKDGIEWETVIYRGIPEHLSDLKIIEILFYAMQLRSIGMEDQEAKKAICGLFGILILKTISSTSSGT